MAEHIDLGMALAGYGQGDDTAPPRRTPSGQPTPTRRPDGGYMYSLADLQAAGFGRTSMPFCVVVGGSSPDDGEPYRPPSVAGFPSTRARRDLTVGFRFDAINKWWVTAEDAANPEEEEQ